MCYLSLSVRYTCGVGLGHGLCVMVGEHGCVHGHLWATFVMLGDRQCRLSPLQMLSCQLGVRFRLINHVIPWIS